MAISNVILCYCKLPMFLDGDEYLCPARFDGEHNAERETTERARVDALHTTRTEVGALGGAARAQALSPYETRKIAQRAAKARWDAQRRTKI